MAKKKKDLQPFNWKRFGHYSFIVGIILAIALALIPEMPEEPTFVAIVILGLIVGILNITQRETQEFLLSALVLMVFASVTALTLGRIDTRLISMWSNVLLFVAFAAVIVALKTVVILAEER